MAANTRADIHTWLVHQGLAGVSEPELLSGFCERLTSAGIALSQGMVFIDTLHPVIEGRGFRWEAGSDDGAFFEYGSTNEGEAAETWRRTPFYAIEESGETEMRIRLDGSLASESTMLFSLRDKGHTDYLAFVHRFSSEAVIGEMDCIYSQWVTRRPDGFTETELAALRELVPALALAAKPAALARIARTLVQVYLGNDAGARVLAGRISRGVPDRIKAVLWFSDLRGFTAITDSAPPEEIIPFLNDYAEAAITAIQQAGGSVLKLMGDGVLAIFEARERAAACRAALRAENVFRSAVRELSTRRAGEGRPATSAYVGLHIGAVFYGNIGSHDRLDFTVVGPAVNEVSRIASMCRSVDRDVLVSAAFHEALGPGDRKQFVSAGRFALRGVRRAQELFTLDPAIGFDAQRRSEYEQALTASA